MRAILFVMIGGGFGSALRYTIGITLGKFQNPDFPWVITFINTLGCFTIGYLYGLVASKELLSKEVQLFLITGVCGGFTSYSTFSFDIFKLFNDGQILNGTIYVLSNVLLGIFAIIAGFYIYK